MRVQAFGRAQIDGGEGAQPLAQQMGVHRAGRQDHRDGRTVRPGGLVGQDDMTGPAAHRILGLGARIDCTASRSALSRRRRA